MKVLADWAMGQIAVGADGEVILGFPPTETGADNLREWFVLDHCQLPSVALNVEVDIESHPLTGHPRSLADAE